MDLPEIPENFAQDAEKIRKTAKETLSIKLKPSKDLKLWQSKVGGVPYLPLDQEYPCNYSGRPLQFLMQLNFSETPLLSGYPEKGILEFYIDSNDNLSGLDLENPTNQDGFRVLYFSSVDEDETKLCKDINVYKNQILGDGPISKDSEFSMEFSLQKQYMNATDYRFDEIIPFAMSCEKFDEYNKLFSSSGHRVGGYPYFTQTDPRERQQSFEGYELLLQLDSDSFEGNEVIMWGDGGIGAFFIRPEDLQKCDFTKILYNWDCF